MNFLIAIGVIDYQDFIKNNLNEDNFFYYDSDSSKYPKIII